jgi:single-stranded-DNA-specific exonuclease
MNLPARKHDLETPFLGVESSFSGRKWVGNESNERLSLAITQSYGLPPILGDILASRQIAFEHIPHFLNPTLRHFLPDPYHLQDMEKAVLRIIKAIENQEQIAVLGDYDVDGATSSALLMRFFKAININILCHIPDRIKEGYGPNINAFKSLRTQSATLILTVDCGTLSYEPIAYAFDNKIDIIVLDHHVAEPSLPQAYAIVNPNRLDDDSPHKNLAAVGVTYLFLIALNRQLRLKGFFATRSEPDLLSLLDLVALGTVCDVMKLKDLNRAFVSQGLKVMSKRQNLGLSILADVAKLSESLSAYHLGFLLGPRINAGGRIGQSDLGVQLLTTDQPALAQSIAQHLDSLNKERQEMELSMVETAMLLAESESDEIGPLIVANHDWHPGIIGIVASRLKDRYHRPTIIIAINEGIGKGSGRSVYGFEMGKYIIAAKQEGIILEGGGHDMAAGLSIEEAQIPRFKAFMKEKYPYPPYNPPLEIDATLLTEALTPDLVKHLEKLGPFGSGNPSPRLVIPKMRLVKIDQLAKNTLRLLFKQEKFGKEHFLNAIAFKAADTSLGRNLKDAFGKECHIAGQLKIDNFRGGVQFSLEDAAF